MENIKITVRENLLGIITKLKISDTSALKHLCDAIENEVIDVYLQNVKDAKIDLEMSSKWSCEFMNLCGFEFHYELKDDNNVEITNDKCYWNEKFGTNPMLCSMTLCILTRFAMKTGREITLKSDKTLMGKDDSCCFKVNIQAA